MARESALILHKDVKGGDKKSIRRLGLENQAAEFITYITRKTVNNTVLCTEIQ